MLKDIIRLGGILCMITLIITLALAGANYLTKDRIADNNIQKEIMARREVIDADSFDPLTKSIYAAKKAGKTQGYCVNVAPKGYGGDIRMIVGVDTEGTVTGVKIISHSETAGLGARVRESTFIDQFKGKTSAALGENIDAISGATVSSRAVTEGVNDALSVLNNIIKGG